jgi:hypothetical protein
MRMLLTMKVWVVNHPRDAVSFINNEPTTNPQQTHQTTNTATVTQKGKVRTMILSEHPERK